MVRGFHIEMPTVEIKYFANLLVTLQTTHGLLSNVWLVDWWIWLVLIESVFLCVCCAFVCVCVCVCALMCVCGACVCVVCVFWAHHVMMQTRIEHPATSTSANI